MLKIYNAIGDQGKVVLKKGIPFQNERFSTGHQGYGDIISGKSSCEQADYLLESLPYFLKYVENIELFDGFIRNKDLIFYNPYSLKELEEYLKSIKINENDYESFGLNEEAILLFADFVDLKYKEENKKIKRILGRYPETASYILLPGAEFEMNFPDNPTTLANKYEVLQSKGTGKQLILTKLERNL